MKMLIAICFTALVASQVSGFFFDSKYFLHEVAYSIHIQINQKLYNVRGSVYIYPSLYTAMGIL